jgi:hypothetical protein
VHAHAIDTGNISKKISNLEDTFRTMFSDDDEQAYRTNRQFLGMQNPFFPDKLLGHGCCSWATESAGALATWFVTETKLEPWW